MQTRAIIEGMTILEKYRDNADGYNTGAEHDTIHVYATDSPVEQPDLDRLIELGWFQEDVDCDGGDFEAQLYDPGESWTCFA